MKIFFIVLFIVVHLTNAQHQDKVDFLKAEVVINPNGKEKRIDGTVIYDFKLLEAVDSVFLDAKAMSFSAVKLNGKNASYRNHDNKIWIKNKFKKGSKHKLIISYSCTPKQTVYFIGWDDAIKGNEQIWTQGQGKYTSYWLPSFDAMEEKFVVNLTIKSSKNSTVIANGISNTKPLLKNDTLSWQFNMKKPMSSYLLAFAIGTYNKQELISKSGIRIENYYYPKDSIKVEPTYRYTKEIFDFMEQEIGIPYPWQNYKQVPVHDFLYAGMENTTATLFSDGYVIDSTAFIDRNYINVNAHELAHQWFGNLVTEKNGNHHWLHEGFATYYAQLAEKKLFGNEHYYWKLYNSLLELQKIIDRGEGQSLTDPNASSLIFYEKGAWAIYMLRNLIGDAKFKLGIKKYLKSFAFKNATINDFLSEMEKASGISLSNFSKTWLEGNKIPFNEAKAELQNDAESLRLLFEMENKSDSISDNNLVYQQLWLQTNSIELKNYIIHTKASKLSTLIWEKALDEDDLRIRRAISLNMDTIPLVLKEKFEKLLFDKSYVTIENALFKLWVQYPSERRKYLDQTKAIMGLPNKNVRLLWLTLAILTNDYNAKHTQYYFQELSGYTAAHYSYEVRMSAFQYLNQAIGLNDFCLANLVSATQHHSWQFKKFARNLVDQLIQDVNYKARFTALTKKMKDEELRYIKTKLNK